MLLLYMEVLSVRGKRAENLTMTENIIPREV